MNFKRQMAKDLAGGIKMIEGDDNVREQKCLQDIQRTVDQYDCVMIPEIIISGVKVMSRVSIVAKSRTKPADAIIK